jgi:hypothetical protein
MKSHTSAPPKSSEIHILIDDPIVNEVRETRQRLSEVFSNDVTRITRDLIVRQQLLGSRLLPTKDEMR